MKYSKNFEKDYEFYINNIDIFNFDGVKTYYNKKGIDLIQYDIGGKSAKECFYSYDTNGKIIKTNEPELLYNLYKVKGSINLHIKMFAEDRANDLLCLFELKEFINQIKAPNWFLEAVENQKYKYYDKFQFDKRLLDNYEL